ncbi:FAD-binding oxidoreductase [Lichenihabitans sp. PAMC28606]|uniref:FAD-binding oxidoreductase n=1 Tax=Lichenihabitans sp. PAMC28606 TaxID=2880932 RepID=UPI001D09FA55|nr:FAD-binding oxidoreductase [Lichenihabitans sp. PAMC28606]UDL95772.1 FAD-binding oxidoreductase [Lichenihabitans sp. PAMC28606]
MLAAAELVEQLAAIVGAAHVVTDSDIMAPHLVEPRGLYRGSAVAVVRPGTTAEVAAILALCHRTRTPVVPQGGNTGLVGAQVPFEHGGEVVLSLRRLDRVREVDAISGVMTVEAGVTLARVQSVAEDVDRLFPLSLASEGSCTIGGNLATNAGGTAVLHYGNARDLVLGLEVVLADGRVLSGLNKLRKDNTGYDLKHLFMGQEGTLGIITAASLRLFPRPRSRETAFIGIAGPDQALALLALAQSAATVTTFELVPRIGIDLVLTHTTSRDPLAAPHAWYVLLEISSPERRDLIGTLEALLADALDRDLIEDAAIAASLDQRDDFWRIREDLSSVQGKEGGSIKHDVSVAVADIPSFMAEAEAAVLARMPDVRIVAFGHVGDGNLHYNLSQPKGADKAAFLGRWHEMNAIVHGVVARYNGSVAAEHGVGRLKRELLETVKDPVAHAVMRALKATLDPRGILNPGKVLG